MEREKVCAACGRRVTWRKKWARVWSEVIYCSAGCRRRRIGPADEALERAILALLEQRPAGASICPSEAARAVRPEDWRPLLPSARAAARRLVARGQLVITQGGRPVDPSTARGPIRLVLKTRRPC